MTGWRDKRKARPVLTGVRTRSDWLGLLDLASKCAADADRSDGGEEALRRRADLANRINGATPELFEREAGAATSDVAKGFIRITRAFARRETAEALRRGMAAMVSDGAAFLDQRLHQLATDDFKRAHAGRPEVWG